MNLIILALACRAPHVATPEKGVDTDTPADTGVEDTGDTDTIDDTSDTAIDTATAPDTGDSAEPVDECNGYQIWNGFWEEDENGDWAHEPDVTVQSFLTFTQVGATTTGVEVAEASTLQVNVTADQCGDDILHMMYFMVTDGEENAWMLQVNDADMNSGFLENFTTGDEFSPINVQNMDVTPTGDELHYEWCANEFGAAGCMAMPEQLIAAGTTQTFAYTFYPSDFAEPGITYEVYLVEVVWEDRESGEFIWETVYPDIALSVVVVI